MSADERDELIFLYAAGALEGDERDEVEGWLAAADPDALAHLAAAEVELARLGRALPPLSPSPTVKQRLLQRIAATRSSPLEQSASSGAAASRPPGQVDRLQHPASDAAFGRFARSEAKPSEVNRRAPAQHRWQRWLAHPALAAGLAAVAAGFLGAAVGQRGAESRGGAQVAEVRTQLETVARDLAALRSELDQATTQRSELDRELLEQEAAQRALQSDLVLARKAISVLGSERAEALALVGTSGGAARGRVVWDWKTWYCYLHLTGLAADPAQIYALWLYSDTGEVVGIGPFEADPQGEATLVAPVPHDLGRVVRVGVSIEPDPDLTAKPRGKVVLLGQAAPKHS